MSSKMNTTGNNPFEDELDDIRLALYEKTKNMTPSEITAFIKKSIAPIVKKYHLTTAPATKTNSP